jgi:hypothetical protein
LHGVDFFSEGGFCFGLYGLHSVVGRFEVQGYKLAFWTIFA